MNIAKYSYDVRVLYKRLLPWFYKVNPDDNLIRPSFTELLNVIAGSLVNSQTELNNLMTKIDNFLNYTGQHLSLVYLLNDTFDSLLRGISITENEQTIQSWETWYLESETDTENKVWYLQGETDPAQKTYYLKIEKTGELTNFTVNVPVTVTATDEQILSLLTYYVIAGKTYNINRY